MVINCHSKRKLREQAVIDAEAAIAAQINRTLEKQAKEDPPPEYELPPTYIEAMEFGQLKSSTSSTTSMPISLMMPTPSTTTSEKLSEETELDMSLTQVLTKSTKIDESPPKVAESGSETSLSSNKKESKDKDEPGSGPEALKRTDDLECHL